MRRTTTAASCTRKLTTWHHEFNQSIAALVQCHSRCPSKILRVDVREDLGEREGESAIVISEHAPASALLCVAHVKAREVVVKNG